MKKILYIVALCLAPIGMYAYAQTKPVSLPVDSSVVQIVVNSPITVFSGTLSQLQVRKDSLNTQIAFLQKQLAQLNQPYVQVSTSN